MSDGKNLTKCKNKDWLSTGILWIFSLSSLLLDHSPFRLIGVLKSF